MGLIRIEGLRMMGHHGVLLQERRVGNIFEVNITLDVPEADQAGETDSLSQTVNYAEVVDIVKEQMRKPSKLIEAVAYRIAQQIKARYADKVKGGSVQVSKLAPPIPAELASVSYTYSF